MPQAWYVVEVDPGAGADELDELCRSEYMRLFGSLVLMTGDREVAADLAQEALARIVRHWPRVRRMASPGAYAHRVAVNLAHRHLRRRIVERDAVARAAAGAAASRPSPDPADGVAVRAAVSALPRRQRTALVLRYYADLSVADAARTMRCRPGTVRALTAQAVANLRRNAGLLVDDSWEVEVG